MCVSRDVCEERCCVCVRRREGVCVCEEGLRLGESSVWTGEGEVRASRRDFRDEVYMTFFTLLHAYHTPTHTPHTPCTHHTPCRLLYNRHSPPTSLFLQFQN